ncbi:hypothetical protein JXB31_04045 [Candidatus Woesearchaeota archaeon]|nr:hypothetical protein [Candidatus Woesearchaeota archaeon]
MNKARIVACSALMIFLVVSMPVVFAISIDVNSINVDQITGSSARVRWATDVAGDGQVDYGISANQLTTIPETGGTRTAHEIMISGLAEGKKYYYRLRSSDGGLTSLTGFYDFETLLPKPTGLELTEAGPNYAELRWNQVSGAVKYRAYLNSVYKAEVSAREVSLSGLASDTGYTASVTAIDSQGRESAASDPLVFSTTAYPANITFIEVVGITDTAATITWKTDRAADSKVHFDTDIVLDKLASDPTLTTEHSVSLTNLDPDTRYYYTVESEGTESERKFFFTLSDAAAQTVISDIVVDDIKTDSAIIRWTTNKPASSTVEYSTDDSFSSSESESAQTVDHAITLDNLMSTSTYYFRVISNDVVSEHRSFSTLASEQDFLKLDSMPKLTNRMTLDVSGASRVNSKIFIFLNNNDIAQVRKTINGTRFSFPVSLSSMASYQGELGSNLVQVRAWDVNGNSDTKFFDIVFDAMPPYLNIATELPDMTNKNKIDIIGTSEKGAMLKFYLDDRLQSGIESLEEDNFSVSFSLGSSGEHTVKIIAFDEAGNNKTYEKKIAIDKESPEIEFVTEFEKTHFKLYKISGITEPGAKVKIINFGRFTGCEEAAKSFGYTKCEEFLDQQKSSIQVDPVSYGIGMERTETAGSDGKFVVTVSLLATEMNKALTNYLYIYVTDPAGNTRDYKKSVLYEPGCPDWHVGSVETYPFNIYTRDLFNSDITGSAFFPITYLGSGTPTVTEIAVFEDDSVRGYTPFEDSQVDAVDAGANTLQLGMQNNNDLIRLGNPKASKFDEEKHAVHVYVPITIGQYQGSVESLPDQIFAYLGVRIKYSVADQGVSDCRVYPVVSYDVQKPELLTKWLSPEQINNTIKSLDKMINATEKIVDLVEKATQFTLVACGIMVVWQYVKGFFSSNEEEGIGENCNEQQKAMEKVYWVCDRVMCPAVPKKCGTFLVQDEKGAWVEMDSDAYNSQRETNLGYRQVYEQAKSDCENYPNLCASAKANTFEQCVADTSCYTSLQAAVNENNCKSCFDADDKKISYKKQTTEFRLSEAEGDDTETTIEMFYVNPATGKVDDPAFKAAHTLEFSSTDGGKTTGRIEFETELNKLARDCSGGTLIRTRTTDLSGDMGILTGAKVLGSYSYECIENTGEGQFDPENPFGAEPSAPDAGSMIKGCYNADCPKFDNTKCFKKDDINPPGGLWSSGLCLCLPGLQSHLENYLKIMVGAKKCLQQALIGEVRGGFCERLLAQFVCDLLIEAFRAIYKSVDFDSRDSGSGSRGALGNYKKNSEDVSDQLSDRYGGIVNDRMGLSTDQLVNKACVFAITGDWSMMEGLFENFVDAIEIEPVATVFAESRPYGYDPFTGKMSIGYNIYIGIVPGGETDIRAWLECDKNQPGGEYCGDSRNEIVIEGVPSHMKKNDPPWNENHAFVDQNALYWNNVVKMQISYKVGEKYETKTITKQIWRKGDLGYDCSFSLVGGIQCNTVDFFSKNGLVELYPINQGTYLSPPAGVFGNKNPVSAVVKLRNQYQGDEFYLRLDYPARSGDAGKGKEYAIPGYNTAGESNQGEQLYNLWIDDVGAISSSGQDENIKTFEIDVNEPLPGDDELKYIWVKFSNLAQAAETQKDNTGEGYFNLLINMKAEGSDEIYTFTHKISEGLYNSNNYHRLEVAAQPDGSEDLLVPEKIVSIGFSGISFKTDIISQTPYIYIKRSEDGNERSYPIRLAELSVGATGSRNVVLNVLEDTNGDRKGDTQILYDKGSDQRQTFSYTYGSNPADTSPLVDFIEPAGSYFNSEGEIPIGFNIWEANNYVKEIEIQIKGSGDRQEYYCKLSIDPSTDDPVDGGKCSVSKSTRFQGIREGAPPFFEYMLQIVDPDGRTSDYGSYDVYVRARGEGSSSWSEQKMRNFKFDQGSSGKSLLSSDLMIYIGGNNLGCSEKCISYSETGVTISAYNASSVPRTRVGGN